MSIITKPAIQKGQENVITLAKSELAEQAKIVSDSYFSNQSNWKQVVLTYESDEGFQYKQVLFDVDNGLTEATGLLTLSGGARDNFLVKNIIISDFDGGYLKLYRGDLNTAEFDIIVGSVVSGEPFAITQDQSTDSFSVTPFGITTLGQTFQHDSIFTLDSIGVQIAASEFVSSDQLIIRVYDSPSKTQLLESSSGINVNDLPSGNVTEVSLTYFEFPSTYVFAADTSYYFELAGVTPLNSNIVSFAYHTDDVYPNGVRYSNGVIDEGQDLVFEILGKNVSAVSGASIDWDFIPANWISLSDGGLDSNGQGGTAYTSRNDGDFDFTFNFLGTEVVNDYVLGVASDISDLFNFFGLSNDQDGQTLIWVNGASVGAIAGGLPSGLNSVRISRSSNLISIFLNGTLLVSDNSNIGLFAVARLQGKRLESAFNNLG